MKSNETRNSNGMLSKTEEVFEMEPCTIAHWQDLPKDYDWEGKFESRNLQNWLCPKLNYQMRIGGVQSSSEFSYYKITIQKCVDDFNKSKLCRSDAETAEMLKQNYGAMRFELYQSNNILNIHHDTPISSYFNDSIQYLFQPGKIFIESNLYYSQIEVNTDNNIWVGQEIDKYTVPSLSLKESTNQYLIDQEDILMNVYLKKSMFTEVVTRSYQKITDLLSFFGGFVQCIFFIMSLVIGVVNECYFAVELANKLYDFELSNSSSNLLNQEKNTQSQPIGKLKMMIRSKAKGIQTRKRRNAVILDPKDPQLLKLQQNNYCLSSTKSQPRASSQDSEQSKTPPSSKRNKDELGQKWINNKLEQDAGINEKRERQEEEQQKQLDREDVIAIEEIKLNSQAKSCSRKSNEIELQNKRQSLNFSKINSPLFNMKSEQQLELNSSQYQNPRNSLFQQQVDCSTKREFLIHQFQYLISKQQKIKLTIKYFLNKIFCGKYFDCKENKLISKAQQQIYKDTDIFYIIDRAKEVDKLKKIILQKNQQVLFNFCPKPIIKLKDEEQKVLPQVSIRKNSKKASMFKRQSTLGNIGKLFSTNMREVNSFRKTQNKRQQQSPNMDAYKHLYEAYDKILLEDPSFKKRKNKKLVNSLGNEIKGIFQASKLIEMNNHELQLSNLSSLHLNKKNSNETKKNQTFSEVNIKQIESHHFIPNNHINSTGSISLSSSRSSSSRSNNSQEKKDKNNDKFLIEFSSGTLSNSDDKNDNEEKNKKSKIEIERKQEQNEYQDNLMAKRILNNNGQNQIESYQRNNQFQQKLEEINKELKPPLRSKSQKSANKIDKSATKQQPQNQERDLGEVKKKKKRNQLELFKEIQQLYKSKGKSLQSQNNNNKSSNKNVELKVQQEHQKRYVSSNQEVHYKTQVYQQYLQLQKHQEQSVNFDTDSQIQDSQQQQQQQQEYYFHQLYNQQFILHNQHLPQKQEQQLQQQMNLKQVSFLVKNQGLLEPTLECQLEQDERESSVIQIGDSDAGEQFTDYNMQTDIPFESNIQRRISEITFNPQGECQDTSKDKNQDFFLVSPKGNQIMSPKSDGGEHFTSIRRMKCDDEQELENDSKINQNLNHSEKRDFFSAFSS